MALNRLAREASSNALADFLRGDVGREELAQRLGPLLPDLEEEEGTPEGPEPDRALGELAADLEGLRLFDATLSLEGWERLCRHLAYLQTDLEPPAPSTESGYDPALAREARLARLHLLAFPAAMGLAWALDFWWLLAAWAVASYLLYVFTLQFRGARGPVEPPSPAHAPFESAEQWQAHEPLLQPFDLPPFAPTAFPAPLPPSKWRKAGTLVPLVLALALGVPLLVAFTALAWPVCLVVLACRQATVPDHLCNDPNWLARR